MQARRFHCAQPGAGLRTLAVRFCLVALAAALSVGFPQLTRGQAQQGAPATHSTPAQPDSGQAASQASQPPQNTGPNATVPLTLGEGDDGEAPADSARAPAPQPAAPQPAAPQPVTPQPAAEKPAAAPPIPGQSAPAQLVPRAPAAAAMQPPLPERPADASDPGALVEWECADLLKMANDLKTAVNKTTKDELSLAVVRKAGEIEEMAHKLRDETPPAMGRNDSGAGAQTPQGGSR